MNRSTFNSHRKRVFINYKNRTTILNKASIINPVINSVKIIPSSFGSNLIPNNLWHELHTRALNHDESDDNEFISSFG